MKALFPGSFDPPHLGHRDLIRRAARLCTELIVGVAENPDKRPYLSVERRVLLLQAECADLGAIRVVAYRGATAAFAAAQGCTVLIRGVRGGGDLQAEQAMAEINRANGLDTVLLPSSSQLIHISSRLVKQVVDAGLPLTGLVSTGVATALSARERP